MESNIEPIEVGLPPEEELMEVDQPPVGLCRCCKTVLACGSRGLWEQCSRGSHFSSGCRGVTIHLRAHAAVPSHHFLLIPCSFTRPLPSFSSSEEKGKTGTGDLSQDNRSAAGSYGQAPCGLRVNPEKEGWTGTGIPCRAALDSWRTAKGPVLSVASRHCLRSYRSGCCFGEAEDFTWDAKMKGLFRCSIRTLLPGRQARKRR